ncbi:hypothetical protein FZEAL_1526 [Fusarium zealandicum]|uniref:Uncharacterized protein n=1 Tax=Fusarium zealandicum TaxID=1053134 RepID=A0A8H4XPE6_9HYPO|nr:hypothetical protein FZEAL_1526 [Fusarium zealandicum]
MHVSVAPPESQNRNPPPYLSSPPARSPWLAKASSGPWSSHQFPRSNFFRLPETLAWCIPDSRPVAINPCALYPNEAAKQRSTTNNIAIQGESKHLADERAICQRVATGPGRVGGSRWIRCLGRQIHRILTSTKREFLAPPRLLAMRFVTSRYNLCRKPRTFTTLNRSDTVPVFPTNEIDMSYYDNPQWSASPSTQQNNWDHQGSTTPVRAGTTGSERFDPDSSLTRSSSGASGPQPQDDYAFSYQFDEVDRAYENLQKSGKGYGMGGRHSRASHHTPGPRPHSVNNFDDARSPQGPNLQNFYANQRHQPSRGSNEAEQVMQAKRRMAAQRERELRNLHTEQQYQRTFYVAALAEIPLPTNKHMSEEETRELIARQRSALYGEGPFADKSGYVDETGVARTGAPGHSGPSSVRGHSPLTYDSIGRPPAGEAGTPGSNVDPHGPPESTSRPQSTASPQTAGPTNKVFDNAVGAQSRTNNSSPTGGSPSRDFPPGSKSNQTGATVAPIGTRPSGTPATTASSKRSTTPHASPGGWGRGNGVWGQSSGLGAPASVWG